RGRLAHAAHTNRSRVNQRSYNPKMRLVVQGSDHRTSTKGCTMRRQEIQQSLRFIVRNPGFSAVAILSLALGIGANAAVFSLADVLLLRPLPVLATCRVRAVW